ncbi:MAG: glycine--tRNA ligase [Candidatus Diapherotrites archaeon]|nr:glycine--tRNA ligase [Candidatus Diapherotrites archaeon]
MPKDEIMNLALRRNLFYPAAEIYSSSPSGFWNFGPFGSIIRRKIVEQWRKKLVEKEGFLEIDGTVILPRDVFEASGHLKSFSDPIIQCLKCNSLHRADELIKDSIYEIVPESMSNQELEALIKKHKIVCPKCKSENFSNVRRFNMMMRVMIGATEDNECYLRPETCQSIFPDFLRIYKNIQKLPLGISQAGKSFRNEIAPRNSLLRERELGQMEIEVFFNPNKIDNVEGWDEVKDYKLNLLLLGKEDVEKISCDEACAKKIVSGKLIAYLLARTQQFYESLGISNNLIRFRQLADDEKAFYSKETWDFEVKIDLGWVELVACNYRTDYDLKGHGNISKKDLSVVEDGVRFIPHVFEISAGIDRTFYVLLDLAFKKEVRGREERIYLDLSHEIAPYFIAVFPIVSKDGLPEIAKRIKNDLESYDFDVIYEEKASIGRRYAKIDEIGVPYAITVDYETLSDNSVTLRERNTMKQKRIFIADIPTKLWLLKNKKISFDDL